MTYQANKSQFVISAALVLKSIHLDVVQNKAADIAEHIPIDNDLKHVPKNNVRHETSQALLGSETLVTSSRGIQRVK